VDQGVYIRNATDIQDKVCVFALAGGNLFFGNFAVRHTGQIFEYEKCASGELLGAGILSVCEFCASFRFSNPKGIMSIALGDRRRVRLRSFIFLFSDQRLLVQ
jgi:hypothetical protein